MNELPLGTVTLTGDMSWGYDPARQTWMFGEWSISAPIAQETGDYGTVRRMVAGLAMPWMMCPLPGQAFRRGPSGGAALNCRSVPSARRTGGGSSRRSTPGGLRGS